VGGQEDDDQNAACYGSCEFSDVTSMTSGSYYMDEDSYQQPVSFIFV